ncbi:MAG TPA: DUF4097 family beta strand repeat-containing protein [Anaerolineales bacterium]|nr:DUF4097 family beta strand repeat-containing protein [Anaerolineales bacterium]
MSIETYEKIFNVPENPFVKIGNIRGHIDVSPGEDGIVSVTVTRHPGSGSSERTEIILEQNEEGHVIINAKYPESFSGILFGFLNRPERVDFIVTVPKNCDLSVKTVSGNAEVKGLAGNIYIGSVSGSYVTEDIGGTLKLDTVSGAIEGHRLSGPLTLKSVSGRAKLHDSNFPSLQAKTVSGSLTLETPLGEGPYQVGSVSGRLVLVVPDGTSCTANISSVSGSVHTDLPNAQVWRDSSPGKRHQRVTIGEGGPEISLKSVSGSLRIVRQEGYAEAENASSAKVDMAKVEKQTASKMDTLERIARGELSVDDAITNLQG